MTGGGAAGTPAWMAPELFRDTQAADELADAYSFGVVLWECLTGLSPWGWLSDPIQIVFAVAVEGRRLPLAEDFFEDHFEKLPEETNNNVGPTSRNNLGPTLRQVLDKCFAEDPRERPRFQETAAVFRGMRGGERGGTNELQ